MQKQYDEGLRPSDSVVELSKSLDIIQKFFIERQQLKYS